MLSVLPKLPYNNVKYISAALKMIGKFLALTMFLYCGQDQRKSILIALWIIFLIYCSISLLISLLLNTCTCMNIPVTWNFFCVWCYLCKSLSTSAIPTIKTLWVWLGKGVDSMVEVILSTASVSTGSYSEWINCHPGYLNCVIPLILQGLQGLQNSEIAESATMSLKDVTGENLDHIQPHAPQILGACQV